MKKYLIPIFSFVGILSLSSCSNGLGIGVKEGDPVYFSASSGGTTSTKTAYSGELYDSDKYERIDWLAGDCLRIYCDKASKPTCKYSDYRVQEGTISIGTGGQSTATIKRISNEYLCWGAESEGHIFYAVYPRPSADSITTAISNKTVTANLAAEQNTGGIAPAGSSSTGYVLKPDMRWQLMTAASAEYTPSTFPSTDKVFLNFTPLTTAIQFEIGNGAESDLTIAAVSVISETTQIAGKFTVNDITDNATDGFPKVTPDNSDASKKTVSLTLASNISIQKGKTFTFTLFFLPGKDLNDLKFKITKAGGATLTTRLGYTDGTGATFGRCKKSFVRGLVIPEGIQWTIDFGPSLTEWIEDSTVNVPLK